MKNLIEVVFILDRSGSMSGLEDDTIGGFNSMIDKQKNTEGEALISTILFDHETEVIHDRIPLTEIKPMTDRDYWVRGSTALLDAIETAENIGISRERTANFHNDRSGISHSYGAFANAISCFMSEKTISNDWKAALDEDFKNRKK